MFLEESGTVFEYKKRLPLSAVIYLVVLRRITRAPDMLLQHEHHRACKRAGAGSAVVVIISSASIAASQRLCNRRHRATALARSLNRAACASALREGAVHVRSSAPAVPVARCLRRPQYRAG